MGCGVYVNPRKLSDETARLRAEIRTLTADLADQRQRADLWKRAAEGAQAELAAEREARVRAQEWIAEQACESGVRCFDMGESGHCGHPTIERRGGVCESDELNNHWWRMCPFRSTDCGTCPPCRARTCRTRIRAAISSLRHGARGRGNREQDRRTG